ncbi:MAG: hypothetical protein ACHREM_20700 [Polyangiales bacterium]
MTVIIDTALGAASAFRMRARSPPVDQVRKRLVRSERRLFASPSLLLAAHGEPVPVVRSIDDSEALRDDDVVGRRSNVDEHAVPRLQDSDVDTLVAEEERLAAAVAENLVLTVK